MPKKYYQYKGEQAVYQEGESKPFGSEEAFIKAGGIRTPNRTADQPYWQNVDLRDKPQDPDAPVFRYTKGDDEVSQHYAGLDTTAPTAGEIGQTRSDIIKQNQAQIDAITKQYTLDVTAEEPLAAGRIGQTRAMAAVGGRLGSPMGLAQKTGTEAYNKQVMESIAVKRDVKLAAVWSKIDERVDKRVEAERLEALGNREAYIEYLEEGQTEMKGVIREAFENGTDYNLLEDEDKTNMQELTGWSDFNLSMMSDSLKPKAEQIDWKSTKVGNRMLFYGVNPVTGEMVEKWSDEMPEGRELKIIDGVPYNYDPEMGIMERVEGFDEKPREYTPTSDMKEYQLAQSQGYAGTFEDWQEGSETDDPTEVKLSSTNRNRLLDAGFTNDIIDGITADLTVGISLEDVIAQIERENEDINKDQITALTNAFSGVTPTQARKEAEDEVHPDQVGQIAEAVISKAGDNYEEAISMIEKASSVSGKTLNDTIKQAIIAKIKVIQSEKRTWVQKILPFGK